MENAFTTSGGRVCVATLEEVRRLEVWPASFHGLAKDHRYCEVVCETLRGQFEFNFLVIENRHGRARGVQPIFTLQQDLFATGPVAVRGVRSVFPEAFRLKMLMAGCAAGEGHIGAVEGEQDYVAAQLAEALPRVARHLGASLVVWKDFPAHYRGVLATVTRIWRFKRIASMPATRLALNFASFEEYLERTLSHATRKDLRRKFKATRDVTLDLEVVRSVAEMIDETFPLYQQVLARSPLKFERLTKEFFIALGERMPDRVRFFLWRSRGRLVAFSVCFVHDGVIYDEYLGLDYSVALDLHLYFLTLRDVLTWAIASGLREYRSTPLNYEPKRRLGFMLAPLDLYVAHTSPILNIGLRTLLPWIQPTRTERVLKRFPNANEL